MKRMLIAVALLALLPALAPSAQEEIRIPEGARLIPGSYIVVLNDEDPSRPSGLTVPIMAVDMAARYGGTLSYVYEGALRGFAINMKEDAARKLAADSRVAYVEQDQVMEAIVTQTGATWGIDRVDQVNLPLNTTYTYNLDANGNGGGNGVRAYIIDTGIRTAHTNFGGRASAVFDAFGGNGQDCNGHGTHVAGTVGSATWGVAKRSLLRAVRVLNCSGSGSNSGVIAGVDWVRTNHIKPAVANMSLGGGASSALDTAVNNAINAGVTFAVAAGNANANACNSSPARAPAAITVGSTTRTDARSSFSNIGTCLDIFAPGSSITSTWSTSNTATATISGTSMASPHVAGAAAHYLSRHRTASPGTIRNALVNGASVNKISSAGSGSPNRLLFRVE